MHYFKKMISSVRQAGGVLKILPMDNDEDFAHLTNMRSGTERFYALAEEAEVFVMPAVPMHFDHETNALPVEFDLPFKTCVFECTDPMVMENHVRDLSTGRSRKVDDGKRAIFAVMVHEVAPRRYEFFVHFYEIALREEKVMFSISGSGVEQVSQASFLLDSWLKIIGKGRMGSEPVKEHVKLGSGNTKRSRTIRRIIRISLDRNYQATRPIAGRAIDWTHRWTVRGTWVAFWRDNTRTEVDMTRLGKDRNGDYCVKGYTWRVEHEKGPEDKPLIKKTRILEASAIKEDNHE